MAKLSKRHRNKQKQKQSKEKRNWLVNRPSKPGRKPRNKIALSDEKILQSSHETSKFLKLRTEFEQELGERVSSTRAKRLASCLINSLSNTASRPINFLCTCMLLCSKTIHKSLDVVKRGKMNVHTAVSGSMANGYSRIKKIVGCVGDTVFPSRPCKRKLDEMSGRLEEVERELKRLRTEVTNFSHQTSNTISIPCAVPPSVPCPPSLPPPPPPPPPPVCKPPPVITFKKKQKSENGKKNSNNGPTKVGISLEELTSVKLRKVSHHVDKREKENTPDSPLIFGLKKRRGGKFVSPRGEDENRHPFITLKDIRKVSLKRTQTNGSTIKKRSPAHSKIAFLRHNLRKVENKRSPGGTPVNEKRQQSFGEGLTPIMTRALQKKFKYANPPSPVDSFNNETKSFLEKTFSQTSPCSPMTRLQAMR
ncbi:Hypothetical predicted protein [Paramuricea clavata]|uniref:Uncharacterized protein n=1 Tax=Paramuricea clavata TaxID=317549 RepID=A0A6S7KLX8_PARCT|nr:Hypothetical predicted protein [Paramuricea clavata]